MGRVFVLNYNMKDISYKDMLKVSSAMERKLSSEDNLIIMPHTFQLHEMTEDELLMLREHIDIILHKTKEI